MAKTKKNRAHKKHKATASDDTDASVLNLSTEDTDELLPTMDEEETKEDSNIESGPTGSHDNSVPLDSSVGGDHRGWGRGGGSGRGNVPLPDKTLEPAAKSILEIFKRLGNEQQCAARMINFEQSMSSSGLVSLDNRQI